MIGDRLCSLYLLEPVPWFFILFCSYRLLQYFGFVLDAGIQILKTYIFRQTRRLLKISKSVSKMAVSHSTKYRKQS